MSFFTLKAKCTCNIAFKYKFTICSQLENVENTKNIRNIKIKDTHPHPWYSVNLFVNLGVFDLHDTVVTEMCTQEPQPSCA